MALTDDAIKAAVEAGYAAALKTTGGANADYIPYLAKVPSTLCAVCAVTPDGKVFAAGDSTYGFAFESISKVVTMALAMEQSGAEVVRSKIGARPTGLPFNSVMALELHGDAPLSPAGTRYAQALAEFVELLDLKPEVFTSTLQRTMQTAAPLCVPATPWRALDEIDAGICDGMTYSEIAAQMPHEFEARQRDKLRYRYPRGESYQDVIARLEPVIIELERQRRPLMVIAHQAVLRALYAYFIDKAPEDVLRMEIPLHTVIQLAPGPYAFVETRHTLV